MRLQFHLNVFNSVVLLRLASVVASEEDKDSIANRFVQVQKESIDPYKFVRYHSPSSSSYEEKKDAKEARMTDLLLENNRSNTPKTRQMKKSKSSKKSSEVIFEEEDDECDLSDASIAEIFKTLLTIPGMSRSQALDVLYVTSNRTDPTITAAIGKLIEDETLCFNGTVQEVTSQCGDECCVGKDACDWIGEATVCVGSCKEERACNTIGEGAIIEPLSCVGRTSCRHLGNYTLVSEDDAIPATVRVGPKSCLGFDACERVGISNAKSIDIGYDACVGSEACDSVGEAANETIIVENYACHGGRACARISAADSIAIGSGACRGSKYACRDIGFYGYPEGIVIDSDSCIGLRACEYLGKGNENGTISIADRSCVGNSACRNMGQLVDNTNIDIGSDACVGDDSCFNVGRFGGERITTITVGNNACARENACFDFGVFSTGPVISIADDACSGTNDRCGTEDPNGNPECDADDCDANQSFVMPLNGDANGAEVCSTASTCVDN